jgi:hypothetical protein
MTLVQAMMQMRQAGFVRAREDRSRFFRDIEELLDEAELDLNDYTPKPKTAEIVQNHPAPSCHFCCT